MSMSRSELRRQLSDIEPNEHTYDGIGPEDVEALRDLLADDEPWLAARAVHALARVDSDEARALVLAAAENPRPEVRVALASAAARLPAAVSDDVLGTLLDDAEPGVRKFAVRSVTAESSAALKGRVAEIARTDADGWLRDEAGEKARTIESGSGESD